MTLSPERLARAHWIGWAIAAELRLPPWPAWLRSREAPPVSLCFDVRDGFTGAMHEDAAEHLSAALAARLGRAGQALALLDGLLFVLLDHEVRVQWQARWASAGSSGLADPGSREDRRSAGGVLVAFGDGIEGTLHAAGRRLTAPLPATMTEVYARLAPNDTDGRRLVAVVEEYVKEPEGRTAALTQLLATPDPEWLDRAGVDLWNRAINLLAVRSGGQLAPPAAPVDPTRLSASALRRILTGGQGPHHSSRSVASQDRAAGWLRARLAGQPGWRPRVSEDGEQDPPDSGLEEMLTTDWHERLVRARVDAWLAEAEGRADFARLAPVPGRGARRKDKLATPGLPVQDALWSLRALQEALPGCIGPGGTFTVLEVALALSAREQTGGSERSVPGQPRLTLYQAGRSIQPDLHGFGRRLLTSLHGEQREDTTRYHVVFTLLDARGTEPAPVEVDFGFGWRHGWQDRPRKESVGPLTADLEAVLRGRDGGGAIEQVRRLEASFAALEGLAEELGTDPARAGITGPGGQPAPVFAELMAAHQEVQRRLLDLFNELGTAAARLSAGPVARFLDLCTSPAEGDGCEGGAVWVLGHHPLRIARLFALEQQALREIERLATRLGGAREVPLTMEAAVRDVPAVLWRHSSRGQEYLVPAHGPDDTPDPWRQRYVSFAHPRRAEPELVTSVRPLLEAMATGLFPGMAARAIVRLDGHGVSDRGIQPLRLAADAALTEVGGNRISGGVDLWLDRQAADSLGTLARMPRGARDLDELEGQDEEVVRRLREALTAQRPFDPQAPVTVSDARPEDQSHLALLVAPWERRAAWIVRRPADIPLLADAAPVWEPGARAWTRLLRSANAHDSSPGRFDEFDALLVRRTRGEPDQDKRAFGRALEADPSHPLGKEIATALDTASRHALRVLVADPVWGPEGLPEGSLRVTWADFDRRNGWRLTLLARDEAHPEREAEAAARGLRLIMPDAPDGLCEQAWNATHRAMPAVTRMLWRAADRRVDPDADRRVDPDAEHLGHLGVAFFVSPERAPVDHATGDPLLDKLLSPWPRETILVSMDSLQRWTWTRRGGTRGDFLALLPHPLSSGRLLLVAIESKGTWDDERGLVDGTRQAATAAEKLRERFVGPDREAERQDLLRVSCQEGFRAAEHPETVPRLLAGGDLEVTSWCVSTARQGTTCAVKRGHHGPWLRLAGGTGLGKLQRGQVDVSGT